MTDVLVVLLVVISILLLFTGFGRFLMILFTRPSTQETRDFLTAIEDMVLPMGSFPSRLLSPWSSTPNPYNSIPMPPTSNSESKQEAVPSLAEPTHIHNRTKEIPILSVTPLTTIEIEPSVDPTSLAVNDVSAEFHNFENEIRGLIDPKGIQSKRTKELVADMINTHAEDVNGLRRDWAKEKEEFERDAQEHETRIHELERDHNILSREKELEKENSLQLANRNKCLENQIEEKILDKLDAETKADNAEQVANAKAQERIYEVQFDLRQKNKVAGDKIKQERDSAILAKRKAETELVEARSEVHVLEERQKTAAKENSTIFNRYEKNLKQKCLAVTTSEQLAELAERNLQAFKNEKLMKHSVEIASLQKQLRESNDLAKSLEPWKTKAENHERVYQRLEEKLTNSADEIREEKDHIINRLKSVVSGHEQIMATDEATINRQGRKIAKLKSGKEMQELKSKLEQAKKQLTDAELETEKLRRDLKTGEAKSKQDAEDALVKIASQHEENKRIAVNHAIHQAQMAAAEKAAEEKREYEQRISLAVREAKEIATVEAATKWQQYELAMRVDAENATKKAVAETERKMKAENTAAEVGKQAAKETEMDIAPDPEPDAEMMEELDKAVEHQNEIAKAVKDAVEKAQESANQLHQNEKAKAVQYAVQVAKFNHEKEKNELIAAKEAAESALLAQEAPDEMTQAKSSDVADHQTSNNPIDLTLAATEADEASKLLDEVAKKGMAMDTFEYGVLRKLVDIRVALHNVKVTLQTPHAPTEPSHYEDILRGSRLEESVLERLEIETNHKTLVRQGRLANERSRKVAEILATSGVQKDAILQALIGPRRQVAPIRGLKRPMQSKKPKVDDSQPSVDVPPTPSAKPKADNRPPFASIIKAVQNS